jgi:hypothetical protein
MALVGLGYVLDMYGGHKKETIQYFVAETS